MRDPHLLKPLRSAAYPVRAVWLDTETIPETAPDGTQRHRLMMGMACYSRRHHGHKWSKPAWLRFTKRRELWDWLYDKAPPRTTLYVFAHNLAFDLPVLGCFDILPADGWKLGLAVVDSPPTILTWRRGGASLYMVDTLNLWRMPLAKLGENIGLRKLAMPPRSAPASDWDTYNRRDVEIIYRACINWFAFLREHSLGGFASTLASQAMQTFRYRYMQHDIHIDNNEKALELSRRAYYGGRVECTRIGSIDETTHLVDINSMYPYVMRNNPYPVKLIGHYKSLTPKELGQAIESYLAVAAVTLDTPDPVYPVRYKGKLIFPTGTFTTALTTPELRHAIDRGHVIDTHEVALYEHAPLFTRFVDEIYFMRQAAAEAGNTTTAWLYKILLNSLYGKFGQRGFTWETLCETDDPSIETWDEIDLDTGKIIKWRRFARTIQYRQDDGEAQNSFPAIAAHVTAYARLYLYRLIQQAGKGAVYYMDTDSLLVTNDGFARLANMIHPHKLGMLKHEATYTSAHLHGPKDYRFGDRVKIKGIRKNACWLDGNTAKQEQWATLRGLIRAGDLDAPIVKTIVKTLRRTYNKGNVAPGGIVTPHVLSPSDWP